MRVFHVFIFVLLAMLAIELFYIFFNVDFMARYLFTFSRWAINLSR